VRSRYSLISSDLSMAQDELSVAGRWRDSRRGYANMNGYWNDARRTAETSTAMLLNTGDS